MTLSKGLPLLKFTSNQIELLNSKRIFTMKFPAMFVFVVSFSRDFWGLFTAFSPRLTRVTSPMTPHVVHAFMFVRRIYRVTSLIVDR